MDEKSKQTIHLFQQLSEEVEKNKENIDGLANRTICISQEVEKFRKSGQFGQPGQTPELWNEKLDELKKQFQIEFSETKEMTVQKSALLETRFKITEKIFSGYEKQLEEIWEKVDKLENLQ